MLNYFANVLRYDDQDNIPAGQLKADSLDYVAHNAYLSAQTQATDLLLIGIDNLFMKNSDPDDSHAYSNSIDRNEYTMNRFSPRLMYSIGDKFGLGLKYTNFRTDYSDDAVGRGEDSDENRGTSTLYYYFTPRTSFDLDFQIWNRDYEKTTSDYDSMQAMVNVNHRFNIVTVSAGIGYHERDFDDTTQSDIDSFVWKFTLAGQLQKTGMVLAVSQNFNDAGIGDSYYTATRFDAMFNYLLLEKINFTLGGWFQNSDYEAAIRDDDRWLVSLGADYLVNDFFSVGIEGGLEERDSDVAGLDFDNDFVMFNLKFNYNFESK